VSESVRIVLTVFAVFRVSELVSIDDGPFDVFLRLRSAAGVYQRGADGRPMRGVGRLVGCPYCVGVWVSMLGAAAVLFPSAVVDAIVLLFGIAGAAAFVQSVSGREVR